MPDRNNTHPQKIIRKSLVLRCKQFDGVEPGSYCSGPACSPRQNEYVSVRFPSVLFRGLNLRARYYRLRSDIPCGSTQNGRGGKSGSRSPSGLAGTAPRRRAFGLVFRFVLVVFFVACAWLRRPSAKREVLWCGDSRTTMPKSRTCLCQAHAMVPNG